MKLTERFAAEDNSFLNATGDVAFLQGITADLQQNSAGATTKVEPALQVRCLGSESGIAPS